MLVLPGIITFVITELLREFMHIRFVLADLSFFCGIIVGTPVIILLWLSIFPFMWNTFKPIWLNSVEENMFIDYKEIIDEMIGEVE